MSTSIRQLHFSLAGIVLLLLAVFSNPFSLNLLSNNGIQSLTYRVVLWLACFSFFALASTLFLSRDNVLHFRIGLTLLVCWIGLGILFSGSELYLNWSQQRVLAQRNVYYAKYSAAYTEFVKQHLHPFYYFFFPQDLDEIERINNETVSIDSHGFRGPGPEQRGDRRLAFLIGASAAFGHGSSSNGTTITGYLNQLQSTYFFVNAGVPSWNSTQEFYRVGLELLNYRPDLIVVYDGFNDAITAYGYMGKLGYPAGTPESYPALHEYVDDIRSGSVVKVNFTKLAHLFFPMTVHFVDDLLAKPAGNLSSDEPLTPELVQALTEGVRVYLQHIDVMRRLSESYQVRFAAVWQPSLFLHRHLPGNPALFDADKQQEFIRFLKDFHRQTFTDVPEELQFLDFSAIFDTAYPEHQASDYFIDQIHLNDNGNLFVAQMIMEQLQLPAI